LYHLLHAGITAMSAKSSASKPLKQGTLQGFTSSKRSTTSASVNVKAKPSRAKASAVRSVSSSSSSANDVDVQNVYLTSDEEVNPEEPKKSEGRVATSKASSSTKSSAEKNSRSPTDVLQPKENREKLPVVTRERPELQEKDPRWRGHYTLVRQKMNHIKPSKGHA
jgi:hypothetical protein